MAYGPCNYLARNIVGVYDPGPRPQWHPPIREVNSGDGLLRVAILGTVLVSGRLWSQSRMAGQGHLPPNSRRFRQVRGAMLVAVVVSEGSWTRKWHIGVAILVTVVVSRRSRSPSLSVAKGSNRQLRDTPRQVVMDVFCDTKHEKLQQAKTRCHMNNHVTCLFGYIKAHVEWGDNRFHTTRGSVQSSGRVLMAYHTIGGRGGRGWQPWITCRKYIHTYE